LNFGIFVVGVVVAAAVAAAAVVAGLSCCICFD
jgi:hypothetical protein